MTCEDILISRVPAAPTEEGCSPKGNFVFLGRMERDTKASSGLCCCAKCALCYKWSTSCIPSPGSGGTDMHGLVVLSVPTPADI